MTDSVQAGEGTWPECNTCDGRGCPSCEKTGFQFNEDESLAAYKFGIEQGKVLQRIADHERAAWAVEAQRKLLDYCRAGKRDVFSTSFADLAARYPKQKGNPNGHQAP